MSYIDLKPEKANELTDTNVSANSETVVGEIKEPPTVPQTRSENEAKSSPDSPVDGEKEKDSVTNSQTDDDKSESKVINLSENSTNKSTPAIKGNAPKTPPVQKVPEIDFDLFVPRIKQLKGRRIDSLSDSEVISFALDKLTCDSYKSLKGVENTPAIACWLHLYNAVENGDESLARAICNSKKEFPKALKFMLDQVRKSGNGGYDHNELFDFVEKYYFAKDKPKNSNSSTKKTSAKSDSSAPKADSTKAKAKPKKAEGKPETKKDEPLQLSLFAGFSGGGTK